MLDVWDVSKMTTAETDAWRAGWQAAIDAAASRLLDHGSIMSANIVHEIPMPPQFAWSGNDE